MKANQYIETIRNCIRYKDHPSIIALGPPGIGKTAIPRTVCEEEGVPFSILRLNLMNPSDIRGMAYIAEIRDASGKTEQTAVWAWPAMLPKNDGRTHVVILDDVTNSPTTVQSTAYGMVLEHCAGEHDLSHIRFISTGNGVGDASGAYALSAALLNRFERINLEVDLEEMRDFALINGWDPMIPAFWKFQPDRIHHFDPASARKSEPFPSPRSWDLLHIAQRIYGESISLEKIGNYIGEAAALEFHTFSRLKTKLPDPRAIILGKSNKVPDYGDDVSILYALVGSLVSYYYRELKSMKISKVQAMDNLIKYSERLDAEYSVLLVHDLSRIDMPSLRQAPSWKDWAHAKAKYILNEPA